MVVIWSRLIQFEASTVPLLFHIVLRVPDKTDKCPGDWECKVLAKFLSKVIKFPR